VYEFVPYSTDLFAFMLVKIKIQSCKVILETTLFIKHGGRYAPQTSLLLLSLFLSLCLSPRPSPPLLIIRFQVLS
jgi:hypothetical protein